MIALSSIASNYKRIKFEMNPYVPPNILAVGIDSVGHARCVISLVDVPEHMARTRGVHIAEAHIADDSAPNRARLRMVEALFSADRFEFCRVGPDGSRSDRPDHCAVLASELLMKRPSWFERKPDAILDVYQRMQRDQPIAEHEKLTRQELSVARGMWSSSLLMSAVAEVEANRTSPITTIGSHVLDL